MNGTHIILRAGGLRVWLPSLVFLPLAAFFIYGGFSTGNPPTSTLARIGGILLGSWLFLWFVSRVFFNRIELSDTELVAHSQRPGWSVVPRIIRQAVPLADVAQVIYIRADDLWAQRGALRDAHLKRTLEDILRNTGEGAPPPILYLQTKAPPSVVVYPFHYKKTDLEMLLNEFRIRNIPCQINAVKWS